MSARHEVSVEDSMSVCMSFLWCLAEFPTNIIFLRPGWFMKYDLKWGFGGLPQITILVCIDLVGYLYMIWCIPKHSRMLQLNLQKCVVHIEKKRPVDPVFPVRWQAYFWAIICLFRNFAWAKDVITTSHSKWPMKRLYIMYVNYMPILILGSSFRVYE